MEPSDNDCIYFPCVKYEAILQNLVGNFLFPTGSSPSGLLVVPPPVAGPLWSYLRNTRQVLLHHLLHPLAPLLSQSDDLARGRQSESAAFPSRGGSAVSRLPHVPPERTTSATRVWLVLILACEGVQQNRQEVGRGTGDWIGGAGAKLPVDGSRGIDVMLKATSSAKTYPTAEPRAR